MTDTGAHPDRERLNDYADGLLPPEEAARVDAHLADCAPCRRTVADLRSLQAELAALPRNIQPDRDLRPAAGVRHPRESRPDTSGSGARFRSRAAAAVLLLLGGGIAIALLADGPGGDPGSMADSGAADAPVPVAGPTDAGGPTGPTTTGAATGAIESYERAGRALSAELAAHRDRLDPRTVDVLDRNLAVVEAAIRELEGARAAAPSDRTLIELLESRHRMRLELLRDAVALFTDT